jgi:hypothetical protein
MGVSYGRVANDLPDPGSVTQLLKQNSITMVRIYDANPRVLSSLANTGIKAMVMLPNENVASAASNPSYALQWVRDNVAKYYPATQINGVAIGNEVFDSRPDLNSQLVPAMTNVQQALAQLGLADAVKVSTPVAFSAVTDTFPTSSARFRDDIAEPVMKPMLEFLQRTGSYLGMDQTMSSNTSACFTRTWPRCTSSTSTRRAGAWRTPPPGTTRRCRRRWTTRAATARIAPPSSPAGSASSPTPWSRTPPTR